LALTRYAGASNKAWPAYNTLARDVSCCKRKAFDAVDTLINCGLVEKKCRKNRTNVYLLYPPECFKKQSFNSKGSTEETELDGDEVELIEAQEFDLELLTEEGVVHQVQPEVASDAPLPVETGFLAATKNIFSEKNKEEALVHELHPQDAPHAPGGCTRGTPGVHDMHQGNAPPATGGCTTYTKVVHHMHPKSNKKINKRKLTLKEEQAAAERVFLEKKFREEDYEQVKKVFKAKGVQVTDKMISDLLKTYDVKAVQAAITSCDFNRARNPLAVIKWMLQTGNYVLPVEHKLYVACDDPPKVDPAQVEDIKRLIRQAKAGLQRKLSVPEMPAPAQSFSMR
jgi:hypothetical protein